MAILLTYSNCVNAKGFSNLDYDKLACFLSDDMWNDCICNFTWYFSYRTDACGRKMNPEKTLALYNKAMKKAQIWNGRINKLSGAKYRELKKHWKLMYSEAKIIQKTLKNTDFKKLKKSKRKYELNVDKYSDYWIDLVYDIGVITNNPITKISKDHIENLYSFATDLWNDCICNFSWYFSYRTDACGKEMDPDYILEKYDKLMKRAEKWDKVVKSFKGEKYQNLKKDWKEMYNEAKKIKKKLDNTDFDAMKDNKTEFKLNVNKYRKYMSKVQNDVNKIIDKQY